MGEEKNELKRAGEHGNAEKQAVSSHGNAERFNAFLEQEKAAFFTGRSIRRMEDELHEFFTRHDERYRTEAKAPVPVLIPEEKPEKKFTAPQTPSLGIKGKRKKDAEIKNAEKIVKDGLHAENVPKYMGYIIKIQSEMADRDEAEEQRIEALQKRSEDEKEDDFKERLDFEVVDESDIAEKSELISMDYQPDMFRPEYVAEHYDIVYGKMKHYEKLYARYDKVRYSDGEDALSGAEKAAFKNFKKTYELMQECFQTALRVHNLELKTDDSGYIFRERDPFSLIYENPDERTQEEEKESRKANEEAIKKLKAFISESDVKTAYEVEDVAERLVKAEQQKIEEDAEELRKQYTLVTGVYAKEDTFAHAQRYLEALDAKKNSPEFKRDESAISRVLEEYLCLAELESYTAIRRKGYAIQKNALIDKFHGESKIPAKLPAKKYIYDELKKTEEKLALYNRELDELVVLLDHVLCDKEETSKATRALMIEYGFADAVDKQNRAVSPAKLLAAATKDKDRLLRDSLTEFINENDIAPKEIDVCLETIKNEPFRLLMSESAPAEKNKALVRLALYANKDKLKDIHVINAISAKEAMSIVEKWIKPELKKYFETQLPVGKKLTKEQLIALQPELMELSFVGNCILRMGGIDSDQEEVSLKDSLLYKRKESNVDYDGLFPARQRAIEGLFMQSRGAALSSVDLMHIDDPTVFLTEDEKRAIRTGVYGEGSIQSGIDELSGQLVKNGMLMQATSDNAIFNNEYIGYFGGLFISKKMKELSDTSAAVLQGLKYVEDEPEEYEASLRSWADDMLEKYEKLEQKYGYETPDLAWIMLNLDKAWEDFGDFRADKSFLQNEGASVIDKSDSKDQRLIKLVDFYSLYGEIYLIRIYPLLSNKIVTDKESLMNHSSIKEQYEEFEELRKQLADASYVAKSKKADKPKVTVPEPALTAEEKKKTPLSERDKLIAASYSSFAGIELRGSGKMISDLRQMVTDTVREDLIDQRAFAKLKTDTSKAEYYVTGSDEMYQAILKKASREENRAMIITDKTVFDLYLSSDINYIESLAAQIDEYDQVYPGFKDYMEKRKALLRKLNAFKENKQITAAPGSVMGADGSVITDEMTAGDKLYDPAHYYELSGVSYCGRQTTGNGCWSSSMQIQLKYRGIDLSQEEIRLYRPSEITPEATVDSMSCIGRDKIGSPVEVSEIMNICRDNIVTHYVDMASSWQQYAQKETKDGSESKSVKMTDDELQRANVEYFRRSIIDGLVKHKSPVSLLMGGHFVTVFAIEGTMIKYYDSNSLREDGLCYGDLRDICSLTGTGDRGKMQLVWFEQLPEGDKATAEVFDKSQVDYLEGGILDESNTDGVYESYNYMAMRFPDKKAMKEKIEAMEKAGIMKHNSAYVIGDHVFLPNVLK